MGETSKKPKRGAAKVRHLGRRKAQIARYYDYTYPRRKLLHILKNNGLDAARSWAAKHGVTAILTALAKQRERIVV